MVGPPLRFICVSAPAGVGPSATCERPPPMFKPPQPRTLRVVPLVPPLFTAPQVPPAGPVMKLSTVPKAMVVDVVLLVTVVVLLLLELLLVDELVVVTMLLVVDELVELVVVTRLVLVVVDTTVLLVVVAIVELVVLELVLDVVPAMVDVVVAPGQPEKSIVHCGVQSRKAPVDEPGHVAPPNSFVSHASPASRMPLPHRLMVVLVVVETTVLVVVGGAVVLVVVCGTVLVVVGAPGHCEKSIVHCGVQTRKAPVDEPGHVASPNWSVSHASPRSITPLPQRLLTVLDVVLLVDVTVVLLGVVTVLVLVAIVLLVVAPVQPARHDWCCWWQTSMPLATRSRHAFTHWLRPEPLGHVSRHAGSPAEASRRHCERAWPHCP